MLEVSAEETQSGTKLFLPTSYEQYLKLESPSDCAMSENYIVVADGSKLYVFDRGAGKYSCFQHLVSGEARSISQLQFTPEGKLFFSDQDAHLFLYDFASGTARIQDNVPCASFVISGDVLFTASVASNSTTFYVIPHANGTVDYNQAKRIGDPLTSRSTPRMFVKDGILYCAVNNVVHGYTSAGDGTYSYTIHLLAGQTPINELSSVCVFKGEIYYTVKGSYDADGLYRADLDVGCERIQEGNSFISLTAFGDSLYAVEGTSIKELRLTESGDLKYTGYEISSRSESSSRLSSGKETVRGGKLVVTNDLGNKRISVYDTETKSFTLLPCEEAGAIATDGTIIAVGIGEKIQLYRAGETEPYDTCLVSGNATGLTILYGKCYYVTDEGYCGLAEEDGKMVLRNTQYRSLTGDLYGNLYAVDAAYLITRYSETEFLEAEAVGEIVNENWGLPTNYTSLRADYEGNLYYLSGSGICRNGDQIATAPGQLTYRGEGAAPSVPVSLAIGFEDNGVYLLYDDYMAYSTELEIPNLSEIPTGNIYESVYTAPNGEGLKLFDIPSGATSVQVDLTQLHAESEFFSYQTHLRTGGGRGIFLGEVENFLLIALYEDHQYSIALYPTTSCQEVEIVWTETTPSTRYLTNEVAFSYYPILSEGLVIERLARLTPVTLHATLKMEDGLGFDFAYIETEPGIYGYVPLKYLTENLPLSPESDDYTLGYLKANDDGVTFRAENGDSVIVKERTQVKIYDGGDGRYFVRMEYNGTEYTAQVTRSMIERGNPDALRISLIILLCVIVIGLIAAYVCFVPRKKNKR